MYVDVLDYLEVRNLYIRKRRPDVTFLANSYNGLKFFTSLLEVDGHLVQTCKVTSFISFNVDSKRRSSPASASVGNFICTSVHLLPLHASHVALPT